MDGWVPEHLGTRSFPYRVVGLGGRILSLRGWVPDGVFSPLQLSGTAHLVMRLSSPGSLSASASRGHFFSSLLLN